MRPFLIAALLALLGGCAAITTSPSWVGGGLATTGPLFPPAEVVEEEEAKAGPTSDQPDEIGARHVLVMHRDSQARPEEVTRTRDEALARAKECLQKLRAGADFTDMVNEYSDEPGAAERAGDLGVFRREVMVKEFADAAFSLKVGEISEVVETDYGFHIIKRTR